MTNINTIATDVANLLKDFAAEVAFTVEYDLREIEEKRCVVVPITSESSPAARGYNAITHSIEVGLLFRAKNLNIPGLIEQVKSIAKLCYGFRSGNACCVKTDFAPLFDQDQLRQRNQFTGVVALTFKEFVS